MAIVSVDERMEGRKSSYNKELVREYWREFRVLTNNRFDGSASVLFANGLPTMYSVYDTGVERDEEVWVVDINPVQSKETPFLWTVTVKYSNQMPDPTRQDEHPLLVPAKISWTYTRFQSLLVNSNIGLAVLNSAGQAFDPPPECDDLRPVLRIVRNEARFDHKKSLQFRNALNKENFVQGDPKTWKCAGITGDRQFRNGILYWEVVYEFEHNPETWVFKILDQGKAELIDGKLKQIKDEFGVPVANPVTLNGAGRLLSRAKSTVTTVGGVFLDAGALELVVADGTVFGSVPFDVIVQNEIMTVTALNGNNITVKRGQKGTTAAGHPVNSVIKQLPYFLTVEKYEVKSYSELNLGV